MIMNLRHIKIIDFKAYYFSNALGKTRIYITIKYMITLINCTCAYYDHMHLQKFNIMIKT